VGEGSFVTHWAEWSDGTFSDETFGSSFSSSNPSVISVDAGSVSFLQVGDANINASAYLPAFDRVFDPVQCFAIIFFALAGGESKPVVTTDDVAVVAWVDADAVGLPSGANQDLVDNLNSPFCTLVVTAWAGGFPLHLTGSDADKAYANAFLVKNSGNPEPPLSLDPTAFLAGGNFRLFNRFKAKFSPSGPLITSLIPLQSKSEVGKTPDPCGVVPPVSGESHVFNGAKGVTTSGMGAYQLSEGRIGAAGQAVNLTVNGLSTPWIWSVIRFDAMGNLNAFDHAIFPRYYVYRNGNLILDFPQSALSAFVVKDATYVRLPPQIQ
jgi:hypothetical protein